MPKKYLFAKGLCRNCLISHQGGCKFHNRHKCKDQDEKDPHHAFLCPEKKTERRIWGVCLAKENLSEFNVYNTLNVLEELGIDPQALSETLGRDVF